MLLHTWVAKTLNLNSGFNGKEWIMNWIANGKIPLESRDPTGFDFEYTERKYIPKHLDPLPGIPEDVLAEIYDTFDTSISTLGKLIWSLPKEKHGDGISANILHDFDVAYYPAHQTIILPHHNVNGEIVGMFERWFKPLRRDFKKMYPDASPEFLRSLPRAKYLPLLKPEKLRESKSTSWSFPNSKNLYGLHKAKAAIQATGKAIIFEGAKSVMLAHQYGYPYAVASHTFGCNQNHISMLLDCGATNIYLAFDRQYKEANTGQRDWLLYEKKTQGIADLVGDYVQIHRIYDDGHLLSFKDAPIDQGKDVFETLYDKAELLSPHDEATDIILGDDTRRTFALTMEQPVFDFDSLFG